MLIDKSTIIHENKNKNKNAIKLTENNIDDFIANFKNNPDVKWQK